MRPNPTPAARASLRRGLGFIDCWARPLSRDSDIPLLLLGMRPFRLGNNVPSDLPGPVGLMLDDSFVHILVCIAQRFQSAAPRDVSMPRARSRRVRSGGMVTLHDPLSSPYNRSMNSSSWQAFPGWSRRGPQKSKHHKTKPKRKSLVRHSLPGSLAELPVLTRVS